MKSLDKKFAIIFFLGWTLILNGCTTAKPDITPQLPPLEIAVNHWPGFFPVVLAEELGYYEEEGLDLVYFFSDNAREQRLEFESGGYDGITMSVGTLIAISAVAPDTRIIMLSDISTTGDAVVVRPEIESVADLKGKKIVLGSAGYGEIVVTTMLQQAGLSNDDVVWVALQDPNEVIEMLQDGRVDAFQTWEPFVSRAVADGANVIFTGADIPGLIPDAVGFHESVLLERPEDVKAFMRGWFRAVDFWLANPDEGNQIIADALNLSVEEVAVEGLELLTLEQNQAYFQPGNDFSSAYYAAQIYIDFFAHKGLLDKAIDVDTVIFSDYINSLP